MHPEIESALLNWVNEMYAREINISYDVIREKGITLLNSINRQLPEDKKVYLSFSNGWLQKFLKRHGLRSHKSHGESGSADNVAIARELPALQEHLRKYALKDIF